MFDNDVNAGSDINHVVPDNSYTQRGLALYLLVTVCIVATSWLLSIPTYFDLEVAAQVLPVVISVSILFLVSRIQQRFIQASAVPLLFLCIFSCWSFVLYLNIVIPATQQEDIAVDPVTIQLSGIADAMYLIGLALCVILLHRYFKYAIYLSALSIITMLGLFISFSEPQTAYLLAIFILLSCSTIISFIAIKSAPQVVQQTRLITVEDHFDEEDLLPSEMEDQQIVPELAINALPLNEHSTTHDWEQTLRDLQIELKPSADVDQVFKGMLQFLLERIEYDAAAVGMLQERSIRKIAASGDDEFLHSKSLGWTNQRVKEIFSTREPILSQQSRISGSQDDSDTIHRLDIPVITNSKAVGIVTLFRETMIFDTHDVKLASSIVFHTMIALRQARLQEEVKRLNSESKTTHLTLYSREQFVQQTLPIFEKLGKPRECSIFIVDVDNLSDVNDKTGREAATQLYKAVSKTIMRELTEHDVLGRYGKEGFIVLMDETDLNGAKEKAETIRQKISKIKLNFQDQVITTTASIGLTIVSDPEENLQSLMRKCDMGLFVAKENGCNTVKVSL